MTHLLSNKLFLSFCAFLFALQLHAQQSNSFDGIVKSFDQYRSKNLQEKIFVHTDKDFYLCGEVLWLKLFCVDAHLHQTLSISKVAYVELLNKENRPVLQTKLALSEEGSQGSLFLPQELSSGNYLLRAYTNWMKNFDAEFYFEKPITIVNTLKSEPVVATKSSQANYYFNFFPEGGNLVSGIETKLAFKGVDAYGRGIAYSGVITNATGDTVAHLQPLKFGLGHVSFLPKNGEKYKAIFVANDGTRVEQELPKIYEQGFSLNVSKLSQAQVRASVKASSGFGEQTVYLFVQSRNNIISATEAVLKNGEAQFLIDADKLSDGISQFTVFNAMRQPVSERLYFKKPLQKLVIKTNLGQVSYESRKKVSVGLQTSDQEGKPLVSQLSVSVYQADSAFTPEEDIASYLYLSSDLKGYVQSPLYYFSDEADAEEAADNLMLTHGWRRFKWEEVLTQAVPAFSFLPEYEGHIIAAKTLIKQTGQPAKRVEAYLALPDTNFHFYSAESNDQGMAYFRTHSFYGLKEIFSQAVNKDTTYRIDIASPFSEKYSSRLLPPFSLAQQTGNYLQAASVNMQVQQAYNLEGINRFQTPLVPVYSFYKPTQTYLLDDYTRFTTMEDVLREYVREVVVNKQNNKLVLSLMRKEVDGFVYKHPPLVLVDGIPLLDDYNKIFGFDPLKVKELQIVNKNYSLGTSYFEGILNFKTYKGRPEGLALDTAATIVDYEGLQLQREFYAPVYQTQNQINSRLPDFRTVLYWAPNLKTKADGVQNFSFYTSDLPGEYVVVIQGLSANGLPGSTSFSFTVVNPVFATNN